MAKNKAVSIRVHPTFFDNWFEPNRKQYEKKLRIPISQVKFTEMMAKKFLLKPPVSRTRIKRRFRLNGL